MTTPVLVRTRAELAAACAGFSGSTALVMTMGALHDGHLQLVRQAQTLADHVVVTIFVNPTQFAPGEDYDNYPRTLQADMEALTTVGADLVWAPDSREMYVTPPRIAIDPGPVAHVLEGVTRPTHFAGVALVVLKALMLIAPDVALFGVKDAQQLAVITSVVADLDVPVRIHGVPIVREEDGVARSSRNQYLNAEERLRARCLSGALQVAQDAVDAGESPAATVDAARRVLLNEGGVDIDYVALVREPDFVPFCVARGNTLVTRQALVETEGPLVLGGVQQEQAQWPLEGRVRLLLAAKVGTTRLIDNVELAFARAEDIADTADTGTGRPVA